VLDSTTNGAAKFGHLAAKFFKPTLQLASEVQQLQSPAGDFARNNAEVAGDGVC
jgi:hypothetical protein